MGRRKQINEKEWRNNERDIYDMFTIDDGIKRIPKHNYIAGIKKKDSESERIKKR